MPVKRKHRNVHIVAAGSTMGNPQSLPMLRPYVWRQGEQRTPVTPALLRLNGLT